MGKACAGRIMFSTKARHLGASPSPGGSTCFSHNIVPQLWPDQVVPSSRASHCGRTSSGAGNAPTPEPSPPTRQTSGRGDTTAPPGSPGSSKSTPTRRGRRRKRCEIEEDDVVDLLENSEKRRWDLKRKKIELGERRLNQERQLHDEEMARRDRFEKEMRQRIDRRDEEQREERAALLQVVSSLVRKMG